MISLYIHIPFCKKKCGYCSFYSVINGYKTEYTDALIRSLEYHGGKNAGSVYIGGGTPSVIPEKEMSRLFESIYKNFDVADGAEITVEANPESINKQWLLALKRAGVNRISLGVQSFDDSELKTIGRLHSAKQAKEAIALCKESGFDNISADLIFGLPNQTFLTLKKSLDTMLSFDIPHISCYNLQLEKGTPITALSDVVPDEDIQSEMYMLVCDTLKRAGYRHYEISNFAKDGFISRHNSSYWTDSDYIGLGPSAHSKIGDTRYAFDADIEKFVGRKEFEFDSKEQITDSAFEKIMLSLRTDSGVETRLLKNSKNYIKQLTGCGFATDFEGVLRLTDKGFYLSNTIISQILAKEC